MSLYQNKLSVVLQELRHKILKPKSKLNLVQWSDERRYLSSESSSTPGRWRTDLVEVARGPMLAVTEPGVHTITVMAPTQLLKTELINNIVGYFSDLEPCPMIVMQPTTKMGEAWSKDRLDPMIRDTPALTNVFSSKKSRDINNTILHKSFIGGHITVVGSNAPSDLAMRPVRVVLADEIDKYPQSAGKEGDPLTLVRERTATFWNALHVAVCSPTIEGLSRIDIEFQKGDQRYFNAKCIDCNHYQKLEFKNIVYNDKDPDNTTFYKCEKCNSLWNDSKRIESVNQGKYIATKPFEGHASFHCNKIASPWNPLCELVKKYLHSKDKPQLLKVFFNTQLAETYKDVGDAPDHERIYNLRSTYERNSVCSDVVFLTAGVDVQKNRLEMEVVGWFKDGSYSVDYIEMRGDTSTEEPWSELDSILQETWITDDNRHLKIMCMAVDTGFNTQHVYNWMTKHPGDRVRGIKGVYNLMSIFGRPTDVVLNFEGKSIKRATRIWPVGINLIKSEFYSQLNLVPNYEEKTYPKGFCFYPKDYTYEYFQGLCSEQLVTKFINGYPRQYWIKIYERNEPLDCRVYARAAASMIGMDRFMDEQWAYMKENSNKFSASLGDLTIKSKSTIKEEPKKDNKSIDNLWNNRNNRKNFW